MLALGCDQAGYGLMQEVKKHLEERGLEYTDCGTYSEDAVDYPVYAKKVVKEIQEGRCDRGITANRYKGIRAAVCGDCFSAEATRLHNDANILAMGARVTGTGLAMKIVDTFLDTEFSGAERHARRIRMIDED